MSDRFDHTLEHTLDTKPDEVGAAEAGLEAVVGERPARSLRRIELITGTGRRRQWSSQDKVRIIVESLAPGANVSEVARRNGLSPQQLFGWRREARALFDGAGEEPASPAARAAPALPPSATPARVKAPEAKPAFASVVIAAPAAPPPPTPPASGDPPARARASTPGLIEIAIGEMVVRVGSPVEAETLAAVIRAVRRAS
jgi:transposase